VLSLGNPPELVEAVRSLAEQSVPAEIMVVNSGGGDPTAALRDAGLHVPVVISPKRLYAGAARNLGIDSTTAPLVAFLASDCRAEPGWVAGRVRHHLAGAGAVASVITNASPDSLSARAAHMLMYPRRQPDTPLSERLPFGLSYDRTLFDRVGRFREDLREGEDGEFNARLPADVRVAWADEVRTAHRNPVTPLALLRDQYARGRRSTFWRALPLLRMLRACLIGRPRHAVRQARRTRDVVERRQLMFAAPFAFLAAAAHTAGALAARWPLTLRAARRCPAPRAGRTTAPGRTRRTRGRAG
jgi:glycosyltransferase involved in cell wall biosynthesis